jgi:Na+/proline symporter
MGILIGSAVIPITLCMCWERLTGDGMVAGAVIGTVLALITWLSVAATNNGGLNSENFFQNTGNEVCL